MEKEQEREWAEAQKIALSVDLVAAAKNQLKFLAIIDQNRYLYEGSAMEWAIYRYNTYWLPLLAKHLESPISDEPLVVPLDCEWIWHCHRLNPIRYKSDCEKLFGKVIGNDNVISSIQVTSKSKTEEIWSTMYPEEPYELAHNRNFLDVSKNSVQSETFISYDLVSAVKRQVSFYYQVAEHHMSDDSFLQGALARYRGFLHLIRTNMKKGIKQFCVPTCDVDLIWHSHQLFPVSYCNDLIKLMGKVLEHDDTDSDRTKGKRLDIGFSGTNKQLEETFGFNYLKAREIYKVTTPNPAMKIPFPLIYEGKRFYEPNNHDKRISLPQMKALKVLLIYLEMKNSPMAHKGTLRLIDDAVDMVECSAMCDPCDNYDYDGCANMAACSAMCGPYDNYDYDDSVDMAACSAMCGPCDNYDYDGSVDMAACSAMCGPCDNRDYDGSAHMAGCSAMCGPK